jgi:hypothetical protein
MGTPAVVAAMIGFGDVGLVEIHYLGLYDSVEYDGEVTGKRYIFGLEKAYLYVDSRDVAGLLTTSEDGKLVFEVIP